MCHVTIVGGGIVPQYCVSRCLDSVVKFLLFVRSSYYCQVVIVKLLVSLLLVIMSIRCCLDWSKIIVQYLVSIYSLVSCE